MKFFLFFLFVIFFSGCVAENKTSIKKPKRYLRIEWRLSNSNYWHSYYPKKNHIHSRNCNHNNHYGPRK
jgi:hypothetical protein